MLKLKIGQILTKSKYGFDLSLKKCISTAPGVRIP